LGVGEGERQGYQLEIERLNGQIRQIQEAYTKQQTHINIQNVELQCLRKMVIGESYSGQNQGGSMDHFGSGGDSNFRDGVF